MTKVEIAHEIQKLGPWFHNLDLGGVMTAPHHFLGDYPRQKFASFAHAIPADLRGKTVLDIGCNAGFYSLEMKRRGASRVVAIDTDELYLEQARFAARVTGMSIELRHLNVYEVGDLREQFDVVLFMGVLYHLRHPLLALDIIHDRVVKDTMVFQSMQRGSHEIEPLENDYPFAEVDVFARPSFPKLHFVEERYANDVTNWWIPNRSCVEGMLRAAGFRIQAHPEPEVYICGRAEDGE